MTIAAVVLAGGRGTRMGGGPPKPLVTLGARRLVDHVLAAIPAGIGPVLLSANDAAAFADLGLAVVRDGRGGFPGPLAGLHAAALYLAERHPEVTRLLCLPGDTPFLSAEIVRSLMAGDGSTVRIARHRGRLQPAVGVWTSAALGRIPAFLDGPGKHAMLGFLDVVGFETVDILDRPEAPGGDPFFNVNTPGDLETARRHLARR